MLFPALVSFTKTDDVSWINVEQTVTKTKKEFILLNAETMPKMKLRKA